MTDLREQVRERMSLRDAVGEIDDTKHTITKLYANGVLNAPSDAGEGGALATLRQANEVRQREWDKEGGISLAYRGNELAGETGETCNIIKKLERERLGIRGSRATKAQLAEELADVVICADLIAMHEGIDLLGEAVIAKFNATSEKYGLKTRLAAPSARPQAREDDSVAEIAEELARALEQCAEWFQGYADGHTKKGDTDKAARNQNRADFGRLTASICRQRLAALEAERTK